MGQNTIITSEDLQQFDSGGALCWQKVYTHRLPMAEDIIDYYMVSRRYVKLKPSANGYAPEIESETKDIGQGDDNPEVEVRKYVKDGLIQINHNMQYVDERYLILFSSLGYRGRNSRNGVKLSYLVKSKSDERKLPFIKSVGEFRLLEDTVFGSGTRGYDGDIYDVEVEAVVGFPRENDAIAFQKQMAYLQGLATQYKTYKDFLVYPIKANITNR